MRVEQVPYRADGLQMLGHLAVEPADGRRPGVLVYPAAPGLGVQVKESAEALARLGYVAMGCDLYGEGRFFDDIDQAMGLLGPLRARPDGIRARSEGARAALAARPEVDPQKIAAIGYCFGGVMALELARTGCPLAAVVGFHTPLKPGSPADDRKIRAKVLICTGSEDREAPPADRVAFERAMTLAGVDWRMSVYGGVYHSFTNPDADSYGKPDYARYDAKARWRSWAEMLGLFDEVFAGPGVARMVRSATAD